MKTMRLEDLPQVLHRAGPNPRVLVSGNAAFPWQTMPVIDATFETYRLHLLNAPVGIPEREGVVSETAFVGPGMRRRPHLSYFPARLSQVPLLYGGTLPIDVTVVHTSLPVDGKVSLGIEVNVLPAAIEATRARGGLLIAQMNAKMPYTLGDGEYDVDLFDALVEVDAPVAITGHGPPPDAARLASAQRIGDLVAGLISDGATLQMGIGEIPDATLARVMDKRDLGVWSEMISDGVLTLDRAGVLDPERTITCSFMMGSTDLLRWVHRNERVRMHRTEIVNSPGRIAQNPLMVSINTALQVDLFDQANASRINTRIHSGFGGQTDFTVGAIHSRGGQAIMALRSWHPKADVSTIVPLIDEPVTSFQHSAVVTEYGIADVHGQDERSQARELIEKAAHPDIREELWEEAHALGLA